MLFPYNILAFTEIGLPPTYVYVRRMGIVIMPECCVNASLFLIAELRPANFSDALNFWCQKSCRFRRTALYPFTWGREKSKISCRHDILDFVFPLGSSNSSCRHEIGHDNWKSKVELQKTILFLHYSCNCARYLY